VNANYPAVAHRAGYRCEYCRAPEAAFNFAFEVEHIQPKSQRGENDASNLALGCRSCNQFKSDSTSGIDPISAEATRLYNPRADRWDDHFIASADGTIAGRTPTGRATIDCLKINSTRQVAARKLWIVLGIFP